MAQAKLYDKLKEFFETSSDENFIQDKYLTFESHNQIFGVPIVQVEQIVSMQDVVAVPEFPQYVRGVMNIRNKIIPIIDLNLRFGKPAKSDINETVIIINISNQQIGLVVDDVNEVVSIKQSDISSPPQLASDESLSYLKGFAKHNNNVVLIMDCDKIVSNKELKLITGKRLKQIATELTGKNN